MFLDGLDDRLDKIRADVLQIRPFPTVEQAYAYVRREDVRQTVMRAGMESTQAVAMLSRGTKMELQRPLTLQIAKTGTSSVRGGNMNTTSKAKSQMEGGCTNCENMKHTQETCFKLHGYPDWWKELKARKQPDVDSELGRAALVNAEPQLSLIPQVEPSGDSTTYNDQGNCGYALLSTNQDNCNGWIIDSGATDHMTFDPNDFVEITQPKRSRVANANGVTYPVTGAGTVAHSPSSLSNTLLVSSLSNKLISVGQATEELNCVALIYPIFCLFQDILTKEIIGRGTKREGLYYMDDFSHGKASNMQHSTGIKEREIWLWHRRLGHPSFSYMKYLFPDLFSNLKDPIFTCETCILAKSHRVPFPISLNKSDIPFALIHSDVWGPSPVTTISGIRWFVTFVDDCTRMTWLYLMKHKDDVFDIFRTFHTMIQTQFSANAQILRSDNGGEYINREFQVYF